MVWRIAGSLLWWWFSCGRFGQWVAEGGRGDCRCDFVPADEQERDRDPEQRDGSGHPEGGVESACQRGADGVSAARERQGVAGGDARGDRDPECSAELLGGVDEPGRGAGLTF